MENWLRDPEFQGEYQRTRDQAFRRAVDRLAALANRAVTVLGRAMDGQDVTRIQLAAARITLENNKAAKVDAIDSNAYGVLVVPAKVDRTAWQRLSKQVHKSQENLPPIDTTGNTPSQGIAK